MIVLFTDYGGNGPYTGQLLARIHEICPRAKTINLLADAPAFDIRHAAYLLGAYSRQFPAGAIFLAVVDPGVGGDRPPVVAQADGRFFVGPMNGLFDVVISLAGQARVCRIDERAFTLSDTFHGRDIFAPVAAMLACGKAYPSAGELPPTRAIRRPPADLGEIIYIDDFGNCFTGLRADPLPRSAKLRVVARTLNFAKTFSAVPRQDCFWCANSVGLAEIAANRASARAILGLTVGDKVAIV